MSGAPESTFERALDLLADAATQPLDANAETELAALLSQHPRLAACEFELTAAAIDLAMMPPPSEQLRVPMRERFLKDAGRFLEGCHGQECETSE